MVERDDEMIRGEKEYPVHVLTLCELRDRRKWDWHAHWHQCGIAWQVDHYEPLAALREIRHAFVTEVGAAHKFQHT